MHTTDEAGDHHLLGWRQPKISVRGGTNEATKTYINLDFLKKVWGASPRKFRNFRTNLVHSGSGVARSFTREATIFTFFQACFFGRTNLKLMKKQEKS